MQNLIDSFKTMQNLRFAKDVNCNNISSPPELPLVFHIFADQFCWGAIHQFASETTKLYIELLTTDCAECTTPHRDFTGSSTSYIFSPNQFHISHGYNCLCHCHYSEFTMLQLRAFAFLKYIRLLWKHDVGVGQPQNAIHSHTHRQAPNITTRLLHNRRRCRISTQSE